MPSDKERVYVALYARAGSPKMPGQEDKFHWAIVLGPKAAGPESGGRMFHAKEVIAIVEGKTCFTWQLEERPTSMAPTQSILARVVVGKVVSQKRLEAILRSTPIQREQADWNCVAWVQEALQALKDDGRALGTCFSDWPSVRNAAMNYVQQKIVQHRYDGKADFDQRQVATWDLLEGKEAMP
ncbi:hypothetical protein LTR17_022669 [Elasticomyces elasticus]|nr:hypothetical protein LTR17_022669 [Elasticomyces elasticus]